MKRTRVESSAIVSIGYDPSARVLEVEYKNGRLYQYFMVPSSKFDELMRSESIGNYLATNIQNGGHPCVELGVVKK